MENFVPKYFKFSKEHLIQWNGYYSDYLVDLLNGEYFGGLEEAKKDLYSILVGSCDELCEECGGLGLEICSNPDHNSSLDPTYYGNSHGCPCCGNDTYHRMRGKDGNFITCAKCGGYGKIVTNS